jgi:hypothetical protein
MRTLGRELARSGYLSCHCRFIVRPPRRTASDEPVVAAPKKSFGACQRFASIETHFSPNLRDRRALVDILRSREMEDSLCYRWVLFNAGLTSYSSCNHEIHSSLVETGCWESAYISKSVRLRAAENLTFQDHEMEVYLQPYAFVTMLQLYQPRSRF